MTDFRVREVNARIADYLDMITEKKGSRYNCPLCGSGTGKNKTPAGSIDPRTNRFSCFSCGRTSLNTIGLIKEYEEISIGDAFKRAGEIFGINAGDSERYISSPKNFGIQSNNPISLYNSIEVLKNEIVDYKEYFIKAHSAINETDYPQRRGLTQATIDRFKLGYDSHWLSPTGLRRTIEQGKKPPPASPRLIIPTGKGSYVARDTRANLSAIQRQYSKQKEGKSLIFNRKALIEAKEPIFVVEGEIDALSIIDVGGTAISLGSTGNYKKLLEILKDNRPIQPLVIYLDNDEAGIKTTKELLQGLHMLGILTLSFPIDKRFKDANEYLLFNKEEFKMVINKIEKSPILTGGKLKVSIA